MYHISQPSQEVRKTWINWGLTIVCQDGIELPHQMEIMKNVISRCFYVRAQSPQGIQKYSLAVEYKLCVYLYHKSMAVNFRKISPAFLKQNMYQLFFIHALLKL